MTHKPVNWNTLILSIGFAVLGWTGKELYREVRDTHDLVIVMKTQMVNHSEFDLQLYEVRTRITAVEVEVQKLKEQRKQ